MTSTSKAKQTWLQRIAAWVRQLLVFLFLALIITTTMDWWRGKDIARTNLPPISATSIQGQHIDVNALSFQQPVLVYFWGTWCPVCSFVSPAVNVMADNYAVVSVAMASGEDAKLNAYLQHHGYEFATINDSQNQIARQWSVQLTPTVMVIKEGEIKHFTSGFTSLPGMWWRMLVSR
ncbi:protein disulfide oxidoreductase [Shewanella sp. Scap07]|uniref:protein disulfide oxidoreductase n=1 Tax=Shewanella sp. Scap07 TaxID=2589987 RepID=UPI0015BD5073|nr:protein disulfide oxidoreductase [Shewanella sp. Scap07]QLE86540.1 protein disulfide oxidoreductase [Shewanella sp. Scap07]